ncbi:MAG: hypothetical protein AAF668_01895 [Pseudomonadota bacterium]
MSNSARLETGATKGVNELLARLRADGVEAGKREADILLKEAKSEAAKIRKAALAEAQAARDAAQKESDAFRRAGEDALEAAIRDAILDLKTQMVNKFRADLQRLVSNQMSDTAFLREMILELVGKAADRTKGEPTTTVLIPQQAMDMEAFRENADDLHHGALTAFVRGLASDIVREGVKFTPTEDFAAGARVHLSDEDVTIDLSDTAVAEILGHNLQPRFRAILEGIVK